LIVKFAILKFLDRLRIKKKKKKNTENEEGNFLWKKIHRRKYSESSKKFIFWNIIFIIYFF